MTSEKTTHAAGFTLVEILIAISILSVAMLGSVQFAVKEVKNSRSQNLDYDFAILASNVGIVLQSDCDKVLNGQTIIPGNPITMSIGVGSTGYTVASTVYPSSYYGVKATRIYISKVSQTLFTTADLRHEQHATVSLEAKRFLSPGVVDPGSPIYVKDFTIDAWLDTANNLISCQRQAPSAAATLSFSAPVPASSCSTDPPIQGTWSLTNPVRNAYFVANPITPTPIPDNVAPPTTSTSGTFSVPIPSTAGSYTFTFFVEDLAGKSSLANITAQQFSLTVFASGAGPRPCP